MRSTGLKPASLSLWEQGRVSVEGSFSLHFSFPCLPYHSYLILSLRPCGLEDLFESCLVYPSGAARFFYLVPLLDCVGEALKPA